MVALNDPRIDNYFTEDEPGRNNPAVVSYSGADPGVQSAFAPNSHVNPLITQPAFPHFYWIGLKWNFILPKLLKEVSWYREQP